MDSIYERYVDYVKKLLLQNNLSYFKSVKDYTYMLEHVTPSNGKKYFDLLKSKTSLTNTQILDFCMKNDAIGSPTKIDTECGRVSPTSLRYLFQAHLILTHFKAKTSSPVNIVELGGGYGGLCLAVSYISGLYNIPVESYSIIDIDTITEFQKLYLSKFTLSFPVHVHSSETYGKNIATGSYLISNYCFSEISSARQKEYITHLFPKLVHGFITWNNIPVYSFGFTHTAETEYPLTGELNKYVRF